jgi:Transposase IS4
MSLVDHNDDIDIVRKDPIAGKGNKKPPPVPPKPDFTPMRIPTAKSGPNLPLHLDRHSPSALFTYILPQEQADIMCKATNQAGREAFAEVFREEEWKDVTRAEMYAFLGILRYDSVYKLSAYDDYWNTDEDKAIHKAVSKAMPRDRFRAIHSHFAVQINPTTSPYPFPQVQGLSDWLQKRFKDCWHTSENLCVDETVARFTGRRAIECVIIQSKPNPKGQKIWVMTDGQYVLGWFWHSKGTNNDQGPYGIKFDRYTDVYFTKTECIVPKFALSLARQAENRIFWTNSVFTSTPVAKYMRERGWGMCGMTKTSVTARDLVEVHGVAPSSAKQAAQEQPQAADLAAESTQKSSQALSQCSQGSLTKAGKPRKNAAKPKPPKKGLKGLQPDLVRLAYLSPNAISHGTEYQYSDESGEVLQLAWKDGANLCLMLSTVHTGKEEWILTRKKTAYLGKGPHNFSVPEVLTPVYMVGYRVFGKAVDQADQLATYYTCSCHRKDNCRRWLVNFE